MNTKKKQKIKISLSDRMGRTRRDMIRINCRIITIEDAGWTELQVWLIILRIMLLTSFNRYPLYHPWIENKRREVISRQCSDSDAVLTKSLCHPDCIFLIVIGRSEGIPTVCFPHGACLKQKPIPVPSWNLCDA